MAGRRSDDVVADGGLLHDAVVDALEPVVVPASGLPSGISEVALLPLAVIPRADDELLRDALSGKAPIERKGLLGKEVTPSGVLENGDVRQREGREHVPPVCGQDVHACELQRSVAERAIE